MNNNEIKFEINNIDSFNSVILESSNSFIIKYFIIINSYINLYIDNIYDNISININKDYRYYIFIKGLDVLTNIINLLLITTNNLDLVIYHCHKAYYYYIEFISQLDTDNNHLELSIKDSIIFVYKKTIFELNNNINSITGIVNNNSDNDNIIKIENIEKIVDIINIFIKIFIIKDILNLSIEKSNNDLSILTNILKVLNKINKLYTDETCFSYMLTDIQYTMNTILKIINKINILNSNNYYIDKTINFDLLISLIDKVVVKISQQDYMNINCTKINDQFIDESMLLNLQQNKLREIVNKLFI